MLIDQFLKDSIEVPPSPSDYPAFLLTPQNDREKQFPHHKLDTSEKYRDHVYVRTL